MLTSAVTHPVHSASAGGAPAERTQSPDWSKAANEYVRFSPAGVEEGGSGMVAWLRLKIHTREPASESKVEPRTCSVCFGTDRETDDKSAWTSTPCSHHFHAKCIDGWKAFQKIQDRRADCPMCRLALH